LESVGDAEGSSEILRVSEEHTVLDEIIGYCKSKRRELVQRPEKRRKPVSICHVGIFEVRRMIEMLPRQKADLSKLKHFAKREIDLVDRCEGNVGPTLLRLFRLCEAKQSQLG